MVKVSVIIPTYNRAKSIGRAIKSVLNQTYQDFEIIVVDDGSTDNTEQIAKSFDNDRIKYIKYEKNNGASVARNAGIRTSKRQFIAFQDSDDEWLPEKLEKQMKIFEEASPKIGIVYTGFWRIKNKRKVYIPSRQIKKKEGNIYKQLIKENFVGTPTIVLRSVCLEKIGIFDERLPALEDWELFIRLSKYYLFKYLDEPLVISYSHLDCISNDLQALIMAKKLILEKHFDDIKENRKILSSHYSAIGFLLCSKGKLKEGRGYFTKAIASYPLNIKFFLHIFFSFLGTGFYNRMLKIKELIFSDRKDYDGYINKHYSIWTFLL